MNHHPTSARRPRRGIASAAALALAATGLSTVAVATAAAPAQAAPIQVSNADFVWGLNGYSQKGIFGPWIYKDLTGNTTQLVGSVSGGSQTEYAAEPVPATSMPVSTPQKTPNAIKFTAGTGTADPTTGASSLSWTGSYTINAYPAQFNAPNEIYSDPELTTAADGSGSLTMEFALGEGVDMGGQPTPAQDFGRVTLLTFDAGSAVTTEADAFRLTPDYQGVTVTVPSDGGAQTTSCSTDGGATGWWGSWPQEFIEVIPASVRPHFYSTSCGGMNDNKPPLPIDVDLNVTPEVNVSKTTFLPSGAQEVTVSGSGFLPGSATGTRPPLAGQAAGTYIVFGRFADTWRPSAGAPSSARVAGATKWAVPAAAMGTVGGPAAGAVELTPAGTFTTTLTVDKAVVDAKAASGNYGIYTYPGSGAVQPSYETATPVTFSKAGATVEVSAAGASYGSDVPVSVKVSAPSNPSGTVTLTDGGAAVGTVALSAGAASFTLTRPVAGTHQLAVSYSGDVNTSAGSATAAVAVGKASAGPVKLTVTKKAKAKKKVKGKVVKKAKRGEVALSVPDGAATGTVTLVVRNAQGKAVKTVSRTLTGGTADITLPKLARGRYRLEAMYSGDANRTAAATTTRNLKVT